MRNAQGSDTIARRRRRSVINTRDHARDHARDQTVSTADQKWHFHFPQCPAQSTTISQLQTYRSDTDPDCKSQFPTVQLSMPPDWRWRRERETSYMLGLAAVFAPSPLGGGVCGAPGPHCVGRFCGSHRYTCGPPRGRRASPDALNPTDPPKGR